MSNFEKVVEKYKEIQLRACSILEKCDTKSRFSNDNWTKDIGFGTTNVINKGAKIEKGAINFSRVSGECTPAMAKTLGKQGKTFSATGVSSIFHPTNPFVPIIHMNIRYFEINTGECWFGGGIDLTPHYVDISEAKVFHSKLKDICDKYNPSFYNNFKKNADDYFYIKHRSENRGIGGIFFDHLKPSDKNGFDSLLNFTLELGLQYPNIYSKILDSKSSLPYDENEIEWQNVRRSRYVEFNLIYDRGTKFGLETNGNTESILVSMPPNAQWVYNHSVKSNSNEEKTMNFLKKEINWLEL